MTDSPGSQPISVVQGFATTLCDLHHHKIYDVVLGRSELSLEAYFHKLEGKAEVRVVCMDLATRGLSDFVRQAYGFHNFENYRLRVKVLCG